MSGVFLRRAGGVAAVAAVTHQQQQHGRGESACERQSSWTLIEESELGGVREDLQAWETSYKLRDLDAASMTVATTDGVATLGCGDFGRDPAVIQESVMHRCLSSPPSGGGLVQQGDVEALKREVQDLKRQIRALVDAQTRDAAATNCEPHGDIASAQDDEAAEAAIGLLEDELIVGEKCVAAAVAFGALLVTLCVHRRSSSSGTNAGGIAKHACAAVAAAASTCCFSLDPDQNARDVRA